MGNIGPVTGFCIRLAWGPASLSFLRNHCGAFGIFYALIGGFKCPTSIG
jgi:hypothetical protein